MYDIIIIGAGVAGLTAAIYARRAEKSVLVLEETSYGGQIINTMEIENYPAEAHISGFELATRLFEQAKDLGAEIVFEKVVEVKNEGEKKEVITEEKTYTAKALILATGSKNRKLGLENEERLEGRGVSYCATCDGAFFKQRKVAVVGGGNTAIEDALYLADIAEKVYLIHRRDELRGDKALVSRLEQKKNIEFVYNSNVTGLEAEDGKLKSIEVTDEDGKKKEIEVAGLFVAIGRVPGNQSFAKVVELDQKGHIIAGEDCHTSAEGIFAAGDNRTKSVRQLVTAAADGAVAATEAVRYLG